MSASMRRVLLFTLVLSILTGIVFGLSARLALASQDVERSLKEGGRSPGGLRRRLRLAWWSVKSRWLPCSSLARD